MKVIKNYLYNAGYQILLMLAPLLTTPYVSRVLGAHANGINTYTNGWVTFFCLFGQLGIGLYGNREIAYNRDDLDKRSKTFWEIYLIQVTASIAALTAYLVAVFLFSSTFKLYFLLQAVYILSGMLDVSWLFMGLEDFKKTVVRNTLVKVVSIGLIFLLIRSPQDLEWYILLLGLSGLLGNISLWPYLRGLIHRVPLTQLRSLQHLYPTILLFIPAITTQVYLVVNRIMLGRMSTQAAVAQFDFGDKMIKLALSLVTATGAVMLPHIANKFAEGDLKSINRTMYISFDFCTALAVPIMFGLMGISAKFAPWFLGGEYAPTSQVILWEAPAVLFIAWSGVTGTQYLMPIHREKAYTLSVTMGAIANVVINFILIARYQVVGAAVTTSISELLIFLIQLGLIHGQVQYRKMFRGIAKYLLAGLIMGVAVYRLNSIMKMTLINLIAQVILGAALYIVALIIFHAPVVDQAIRILKPAIQAKFINKEN